MSMNNIVLIGYRCSGKTRVGKRLAEQLEWKFVDTDSLVEGLSGHTIREIVHQEGWERFRKMEQGVVSAVCKAERTVIATGGGVVLESANVDRLKETGWVVWLKCADSVLTERMVRQMERGSVRPPLTGTDCVSEVTPVLTGRKPFYEKACHITVDTTHLSIDQTVSTIVTAMTGAISG